jgi:hypothetical protein
MFCLEEIYIGFETDEDTINHFAEQFVTWFAKKSEFPWPNGKNQKTY